MASRRLGCGCKPANERATTAACADSAKTLRATATGRDRHDTARANSAPGSEDTKTDKPSSLRLVNDTGRKATDGITNASAIVVSGQAEPGANVSIFEGRTLLASANADSKGAFSIDISATASEGSHTLTARAVDLAGNQSADSDNLVIRIDRTAPGAPAITAIQDDTGTAGDYLLPLYTSYAADQLTRGHSRGRWDQQYKNQKQTAARR